MTLSREQLEMRRTGIGSSEIAAIAGLDPYRTAMDVYCAKTLPPPEEDKRAPTGRQPAHWGQRIEWLIVEEWMGMRGYTQVDRPGTLRFGPVALATPDAIGAPTIATVMEQRICEAKNVGLRMAGEWADDATPDHYALQCQWLMGVTGIKTADLCVLIGGQDFRVREIHADPEMFGSILAMAEEFWRDHVAPGVPPPLDHSQASKRWLRERFPREIEIVKPATADALELLAMIRANRAELERAKEQDEAMRNQLRGMIGEAQGIEGVAKWTFRKGYTFTTSVEPGRVLRLAKE